jgi:hypothetical protein
MRVNSTREAPLSVLKFIAVPLLVNSNNGGWFFNQSHLLIGLSPRRILSIQDRKKPAGGR